MSNNEVAEADGIKLTESSGNQALAGLAETAGGKPRSVRTRGFWRAYRRGELLFIIFYKTYAQFMQNGSLYPLAHLVTDRYCPDSAGYLIYPLETLCLNPLPF